MKPLHGLSFVGIRRYWPCYGPEAGKELHSAHWESCPPQDWESPPPLRITAEVSRTGWTVHLEIASLAATEDRVLYYIGNAPEFIPAMREALRKLEKDSLALVDAAEPIRDLLNRR